MKTSLSLLFAGVVTVALILGSTVYAGGRPLSASLSGDQEVPPVATGASGSVSLTLNPGQEEVCLDFSMGGFTSEVFAAHIHHAPAGLNGGVVVNLDIANNGGSGCVGASRDLILAIMKDPGAYYVNVHTADVPSGEIRGQLSK